MMTTLVAQPQPTGTQSLPLSSFFPKSKIRAPPPAFVGRIGSAPTTIPNRAILSVPIVPTLGTVSNVSVMRPLSPRQSTIVTSSTQLQPIPSLNIGSEGRLVPPIPLPYEKVRTTLPGGKVVEVVDKLLPTVPRNEVVFVIPQVAARSPPGSRVRDRAATTSRFVQPINIGTTINAISGRQQGANTLTTPVVLPTLAQAIQAPARLTSPTLAQVPKSNIVVPILAQTTQSPTRLPSPIVIPTLAQVPKSNIVVPTLGQTTQSPTRLPSHIVVPTLAQNRVISTEQFRAMDTNNGFSRQQTVIPVKSVRSPPKSPLAGLTVKLVASQPR